MKMRQNSPLPEQYSFMQKKPRFKWVCLFLSICVLVLAPPLTSVTFAAEDTIVSPALLSPRKISIPVTADLTEVYLTDATGRQIPLTGKGVQVSTSGSFIFPPKLVEGTYTITYPGGVQTFSVGVISPADATPSNFVLVWIVTGSIALLGGILFTSRRRVLAVGVILIAAMTPLAFTMLSPALDMQAPDPCLGIYDESPRLRCMFAHVQSVLDDGGTTHAIERIKVLSARSDKRWGQVCHEMVHYIGQHVFKEASEVKSLVKSGTLSCHFGYFHGLLESVGMYSTDATFPATALSVCTTLKEYFPDVAISGSVNECMHGIGHASMWRHNEDLTAARLVCVGLPEERWRQECDSGAVMSWVYARELSRVENRPQDAPEPVVTSPLDLCSPPLGVLSAGCTRGALSGTLRTEYADSVAWCLDNPSQLSACAAGLARRLIHWESSLDGLDTPTESQKLCETLYASEPAGKSDCITEVAWSHLTFLRDYNKTQQFCAALREEFFVACRKGILLVYEEILARGDETFGVIPPDVLEELERGV